MASVRKKNDKWQVQVRRKGASQVSKTFTLKSDALKWARMMEANHDRGDMPVDVRALESIVLDELIGRYLDEIVPSKKGASVETAILKAFRRHQICKKTLSAISPSDWNDYRDQRLITISPKSLKRQLSPLRHMFNIASQDWGIPIKENPIAKIKFKTDDRKRNRRLQDSEENALIKIAAKTKPGYLHQVIRFALETGMRRGEILAIQKSHVNLVNRLLEIPVTKNGEPRTIPLTVRAAAILEQALSALEPDEIRPFSASEDALRHSWSRACKKANIENLHFHDLRHEAISRFFEMGLTTPEVALISGHKDVRMLFRYAHATQKSIFAKFQNATADRV